MARFGQIWLEIARDQYLALPTDQRELIDARLETLLENPAAQPASAYDRRTDQWTTTYGGGAGLIVYAVVPNHQRLVILRIV